MSGLLTFTIDKEFRDSFQDISESRRRLIRITGENHPITGTYTYLKLFRKGPGDEFCIDQRVTLRVPHFHELINIVENISMGPLEMKEDSCVATFKRTEKALPSKALGKSSKLR